MKLFIAVTVVALVFLAGEPDWQFHIAEAANASRPGYKAWVAGDNSEIPADTLVKVSTETESEEVQATNRNFESRYGIYEGRRSPYFDRMRPGHGLFEPGSRKGVFIGGLEDLDRSGFPNIPGLPQMRPGYGPPSQPGSGYRHPLNPPGSIQPNRFYGNPSVPASLYRPDPANKPSRPGPKYPGMPQPDDRYLYPSRPRHPENPHHDNRPTYPSKPGYPGMPNPNDRPLYPSRPRHPGMPHPNDRPSYPSKPRHPGMPNPDDRPSYPSKPRHPGMPNPDDRPSYPSRPRHPGMPNPDDHPSYPPSPRKDPRWDSPKQPSAKKGPSEEDHMNTPEFEAAIDFLVNDLDNYNKSTESGQ